MQGRFKRDGKGSPQAPQSRGEAAAEQERSASGSSAQHAPSPSAGAPKAGEARPGTGTGGKGAAPAASAAPATPGTGNRLLLRNWRISTRLVSLLALPVVAATTLGGMRINQSMEDIEQLDNMRLLTEMTKQATELASALQKERDQSAGPLANGGKGSDFDVKGPRDTTDRERQAFMEATHEIQDRGNAASLDGIRNNVIRISGSLTKLSGIRQEAYKDDNNTSRTVEAYSRLIDQLLSLSQDMAQATSNPDMIQRTRALAAFSSAKEYASVQRAIIAAALPPNNRERGDLSETDRQYGDAAQENQADELSSFRNIYQGGNVEELLKPIEDGSPTIKEADAYAKRVLTQPDGMRTEDKRSYKDWVDADTAKIEQMTRIELTLLNQMEQQARELRNESEQEAIISGALVFLVLGVSLVGAFVVARSMIRSLRRLQDTATKVAQDRLPELVKHLSESDPQDVDTSVESVGVHSRDEIGKVAAAFDDVHREAVRLAAEQALLRGNVNAMFTNLSRRSQGLIQRQLSLISELESREADPDQLSSLFKLDHLATRMRRNGENLLVLAGEEPGRRWTRPVPLVDVLRAAASEVEQYERIELSSVPATEVAGRVVNDLVHLLAELLENATSFSSPQTKVKVTGHALPDGRVLIEIHDTGIGLSPEDLASINERLAAPPTVDVSVSRRMGLFVVGRLSQRHGIRIQLRPSDSGGTTALVMLPVDVAQGGRKMPAKPGGGVGGSAAAQAAAGRRSAVASQQAQNAPSAGGSDSGGKRLGSGPGRGQVQGTGPRAALPTRDTGGRGPGPGGTGPQQGGSRPGDSGSTPAVPQQPQQGRPGSPVPAGLQSAGTGLPGPRQGEGPRPGERGDGTRRPQLPPPGGPRPELPGGPRPANPGWGEDRPGAGRPVQDGPRGHEEPDSTAQFPQLDDRQGPGSTGQFARSELDGPGSTGEFARPVLDGPGSTGQFPRVEEDGGRPEGGPPQPNAGPYMRSDVFGGRGPARRNPGGFASPPPGRDRDEAPAADYPREDTGSYPRPAETPYEDTGSYPGPAHADYPGADGGYPREDTGSYPRPADAPYEDTGAYPSPANASYEDTGSYPRPGSGGHEPQGTGSFPRPDAEAPSENGRYEAPVPPAQRPGGVLPPSPSAPRPSEPEALPPASGPGDGRTPLYDTLETSWFRGQQAAAAERERLAAQEPQQPAGPPPGRPGTGRPQGTGPEGRRPGLGGLPGRPQQPAAGGQGPDGAPRAAEGARSGWRSSPNDELVRQAERVRQPSAGGVTDSGLPRRVPRANLVPGTAESQQQQTAGPQVSRAPDEVRGRLTNLRRGIQQGRQAGGGPSTGSFPRPTHQQER
ncbi:nitrate- and nitrite sensing domain-containing protein [Streptomyces sp. SCSIO ZS0520]|uniref:sensor histidine kinase n=1 Tax=Streptomyces sp. SCSIO ZS0520 TaxID=2892996 RepID=UPI0021D91AAA|nr:nitrate- and nitrite sensing domain-containing protein [Streptomyces sp. SCSIO ZS0520]